MEQVDPSPSQPGVSSINSSQEVYTPTVKNDLIPKINQEFDTLDDVHVFYNNYARDSGFSVRIDTSKKNRLGEVIRKEYVCYKEGVKESKPISTVRRRGLTREGCRAKLSVVKKGEKWVVSQFFEGHSHSLTSPKRVHLLKSHRKVSLAQRALTQTLAAANVPICQQMGVLELEAGGLQNVGFIRQDLYNAERDRRNSLSGHDADMLLEHFQLRQEENSGFFYTYEKDDEGRLTHCFWADATSRKSYAHFGDVVVFDTTYNTNRYCMIFAPILGVNHHGQTTLFGCGLLKDETTDSFQWLFKVWLKAMPGGPPKMIITDQDAAMTKAFENVLPNTFHRYCIWHITNKFSEKISPIAYKEHGPDSKACIWDTETPQEFEEKWAEVLYKAKLTDNEWLSAMYQIRHRWIPAFTRHIFSAHMTSSQRAEICHSFFKKHVRKENTLFDFVTRFDRALSKMRHNELELDHKDVNEKPQLKTAFSMEPRLNELYTRAIFLKFQDQLFQSGAYLPKITIEDEHHCRYNVKRAIGSTSRGREIVVDKLSGYVTCSCKMFDSDGICCRHMLAYFNKKTDIVELPDEYVLRRWTKAAKASRVMDDLGIHPREICDTPLLVRRHRLMELGHSLIDHGVLDEEGTKLVEEGFELLMMRITMMRSSRGSQGNVEVSGIGIRSSEISVKEPLKVRAKGCGKRLKGGKEKALAKRIRRCHACGGVSHDKRTCPNLKNISSQETRLDGDEDGDEDDIHLDHDCSVL